MKSSLSGGPSQVPAGPPGRRPPEEVGAQPAEAARRGSARLPRALRGRRHDVNRVVLPRSLQSCAGSGAARAGRWLNRGRAAAHDADLLLDLIS